MKEQFVPYEKALKLKELGFDEECFTYFKNGIIDLDDEGILEIYKNYDAHNDIDEYISSPLWQQAFDWFREEHGIHSYINLTNIQGELTWHVNICSVDKHEVGVSRIVLCNLFDFKTYEEARQACLEKLIELCKNH